MPNRAPTTPYHPLVAPIVEHAARSEAAAASAHANAPHDKAAAATWAAAYGALARTRRIDADLAAFAQQAFTSSAGATLLVRPARKDPTADAPTFVAKAQRLIQEAAGSAQAFLRDGSVVSLHGHDQGAALAVDERRVHWRDILAVRA